jgi:hypothetical protein
VFFLLHSDNPSKQRRHNTGFPVLQDSASWCKLIATQKPINGSARQSGSASKFFPTAKRHAHTSTTDTGGCVVFTDMPWNTIGGYTGLPWEILGIPVGIHRDTEGYTGMHRHTQAYHRHSQVCHWLPLEYHTGGYQGKMCATPSGI